MRVRDGGDGANLVVGRFGEGQARMRMRDPLPLSRSPARPRPEESASAVVPPMSKRPLTVYAPSRYQRTKRSRMSRTSMRPVARMLSHVASAMEVSSLQVPGGWL